MAEKSSEATDGARQARSAERVRIQAEVMLRRTAQNHYRVSVYDLSRFGCKVEFVERPKVDESVWVKFEGLEAIESKVCWTANFIAGVEFQHPLHPAVFGLLVSRLR